MPTNEEKLVLLFEAQNKDVLRKLNQIERTSKRAFDNSRRPLKSFNRDMVAATKTARSFAAAFTTGFAGVAITGGILAMPAVVRGLVAEASNIAKVADKIGLTTEELQRMRYGFELAGVAANQTDTAMQRFSRRVAQAANGSGELYEILKQNGVVLRNQDCSMRSQVDILRDYADLIKNAGSEQERLLLAFKAFDTEGAALVNALRNGAAGLTAFMQKADEAGGVLRDELIREMERVDDEFAKLARTVGVTMKRAVLDLVAAFGELGDADPAQTLKDVYKDLLRQRENISGELQLARSIGDNALAGELQQTIGALDARLKAIQDERRLRATTGDVGPGRRARRQPVTAAGEPVTIVPDKTRDSATRALANQQKAVLNLIAALELEQAALGKTAAEQRVMIELARAGEAATEGQKDQIRSLVNEIEAQRAAQERVNDITRFGGDLMYDQWGQIASSIQTGNAALDRFLQTMLDVTAQAVIFGEGPLASLLGGGKAGGAGGLLGLLFGGARAQGGPVSPGRAYMVGEKGPEMIVPKQAGTVIPNHALSGGGVNFSPVTHIDARGSNLSEAQLQTILDERDRRLIPAAVQAVGQSNRFNTNPAFR